MARRTSFIWSVWIAVAVLAVVAALVAANAITTALAVPAPGTAAAAQASRHAASAAPVTDFDAGDIISDDAFFNADAMTQQGIQDWMLRMPCAPTDLSPCLAFFRQTTRTVAASPGHCTRYQGVRDEPASAIVYKVAQACGISPRVLLVLVQKEQSLVTAPSAYGYQRATGYACPDTAPCEAKYFGFFNQLYKAAWQFREYTVPADHWRYRVGTVEVQYAPDASCGASPVRIADQATAGLYDYTPYQPNAAALAHPAAGGDRCASHGNLNFFRLYWAWFGDPHAVRYPSWWGPCLDNVGGSECTPR